MPFSKAWNAKDDLDLIYLIASHFWGTMTAKGVGKKYPPPYKRKQVIAFFGENPSKKTDFTKKGKRLLTLSQNSPFFACLRFYKKGYCRTFHSLSFFWLFLPFLHKPKIKANIEGLELSKQATHERKSQFKKSNV